MNPSDEKRQFIDAFSQALRDEAPETNRAGWYAKFADETGLGEEAIKKWFYGQNAPDTYSFLVCVAYFGADFANKVLAPTGYKIVPLGSDEIDKSKMTELLSETLDALDSSNAALWMAADGIRKIKKQKPLGGQVALIDKKTKAAP